MYFTQKILISLFLLLPSTSSAGVHLTQDGCSIRCASGLPIEVFLKSSKNIEVYLVRFWKDIPNHERHTCNVLSTYLHTQDILSDDIREYSGIISSWKTGPSSGYSPNGSVCLAVYNPNKEEVSLDFRVSSTYPVLARVSTHDEELRTAIGCVEVVHMIVGIAIVWRVYLSVF